MFRDSDSACVCRAAPLCYRNLALGFWPPASEGSSLSARSRPTGLEHGLDPILIFIVEDEILIRDGLQAALEDAGFSVAMATSGEEAISMLDAENASFKALVTDINLAPNGLAGWDVARHARELNSVLPVVYTTGASGDEWSSLGVPNSILIRKPYVTAQVLTAVSQLLNASGAAPGVP